MGSKETNCTHCIHREVCVFKNDFLEAQKQVTMMVVSLRDEATIRLCDIPFIAPVDLRCKYFYQDIHKRSIPDSSADTAISTRDYTGTGETYLRG